MRVIFMGTPEFSIPALRAIAGKHEVVAVYSRPPRAAGRGQKSRLSPVHAEAERLGIPVQTPSGLRDETHFFNLKPDVAVVVAYGLILPKALLDTPKFGCLNIHASLLPRWRGAAPIHRAVMAGDAETGVSIMRMEAGLDTGPVLATAHTGIGAGETTADIHDRLAIMGAELVVNTLAGLPLEAQPQPEDGVTYATKIDKAEAQIDWTRPAVEVDRKIRGLSPFPGAWCEVNGERVKLLSSLLAEGSDSPGQVLSGFRIACGEGAVQITRAQRAGKRPMVTDELLRGWDLPARLG